MPAGRLVDAPLPVFFSDTRKEPVETGVAIPQVIVVLVPQAKLPLLGEMIVSVAIMPVSERKSLRRTMWRRVRLTTTYL